MAAAASIEVEVQLEANPPQGPLKTGDDVDPTKDTQLSGSADASGASTNRVVPDGHGGSSERKRNVPLPPNTKVKLARVKVRLQCPGDKQPLELDESGNVSATGSVTENCITTTTVSTKPMQGGGTETETVTKKRCCDDKEVSLGNGERRAEPRTWLGLAAEPAGHAVLRIASVVPNAPASRAGLKIGDQVIGIAGRHIHTLAELFHTVASLATATPVPAEVRRGERTVTLELAPSVLMGDEDDDLGEVVLDKECDDQCRCTKDHPDAVCSSTYEVEGTGPHGGILLRHTCMTIDTKKKKIIKRTDCGVGEYF
jgi:PDZ domain